jgi:chromosome segregation ATPase
VNDSRLGRFHYPLQSLLRKHEWDVEALALEHASASAALREQEAEQARLRDGLQQTNAALARMRQAGARLDVMQQRLLMDYRVTQEEAAVAQEARLRAALAQCEQIAEQLQRARRSVKSFEKHCENLRDAHERQARTLSAKEADDAWLMGRRFEEAGS